ncbi:LysR family transcriptional regulator [Arthrobacter sp. VKM Ac-2550]|uniref:LysR family transcriptional regulator n=1 Tax=Crystallibacter permensis TaxID=1938888 RepID=UPI0022264BB6|nr:LysR family transcriptional regulator [Arthrobacter sp. VKM Ac-2550]MCW2134849.1 DNA-binding transcriptional regulator, LysR family [Arthrobacter sp. VKM Ac-2550]
MHDPDDLYTERINVEIRHLRCLVALAETGSFTDAAIELGVSQASISRILAGLEDALGVRLVDRTTRSLELNPAGEKTLNQARRLLLVLDDLERDARSETAVVRLGYAWSALGKHTVELQHRWADAHPHTELRLIRTNTSTAGLAEGVADLAILRREPDPETFGMERIGFEKRYCAIASDDPLVSRRTVTLAQIAEGTVALDTRTGSTNLALWPADGQPKSTISISNIDDWLTVISSGKARGITAEATMHQYRRPGLTYRLVRDAPALPVYAAWPKSRPPGETDAIVELLTELYS